MVKNSFLLDTHIFIWAMEGNKRLSEDVKKKITNPQNKVFISVATVWEIVIKRSIKKIKVSFDLEISIKQAGFEVLPIQISHALGLETFPAYHKDPFDRLLISQAKVEHLTFITSDRRFVQYGLPLLQV